MSDDLKNLDAAVVAAALYNIENKLEKMLSRQENLEKYLENCITNYLSPPQPIPLQPPYNVLPPYPIAYMTGNITMLDSVGSSPSYLPPGFAAYAAYVTGYSNYPAVAAMYPHAYLLSISTDAAVGADVLDIEAGCALDDQILAWWKAQTCFKPCFYTSAWNVESVIEIMTAAGIARSAYRIWSAHYIHEHICSPSACDYPAADGTQWSEGGPGFADPYDTSLLLPDFFEAVVPPPTESDDMVTSIVYEGYLHVFQIGSGGGLRHWQLDAGKWSFSIPLSGGLDPAVTPNAQIVGATLHVTCGRTGGATPVVASLNAGKWTSADLPS